MKKILILFLFAISFFSLVNISFAKDKKEIVINPELAARIADYEKELNSLATQHVKNEDVIRLMFYDVYDLYTYLDDLDDTKDNSGNILANSTYTYKLSKYLKHYNSNSGKYVYAKLSSDNIADFQKLQQNSRLLRNQSNSIYDKVEKDFLSVKSDKTNYSKYDYKAIKKLHKKTRRYYNSVVDIDNLIIEVLKANNVAFKYDNNITQYQKYSAKYTKYPSKQNLENIIIAKNQNRSSNYITEYEETVFRLQVEMLPTLIALVLTSDEKKELEMKIGAIYANSKNLSEQEKKAKMLETVATSEAYIVKSLSSAEASNRLSNLTDEQREQYNYVNYRLNRIFEEEVKFLYKSTETVMNVISDPEHANAYMPQTSREEEIYSKIIAEKSIGSSKIISAKLKELRATKNLEKDFDKNTNKKVKNKKAKKVKDIDLSEEEDN